MKSCLWALALPALGCGPALDATVPARPAAVSDRYEIAVTAASQFPGAAGAYRVITVTDRRMCRTWTVLEGGGSIRPPRIDGRDPSPSLVVLGVDNHGRPVKSP